MSCGAFSLVGTDGREAGVYFLPCKRWTCKRCGPRKVRRAIAQMQAGMARGQVRFVTLTSPGDEDVFTSYDQATRRWKRLALRIERRWGAFEYFLVVEPQKRGHAHLHVIIRGERYMPQRVLAAMARDCGFGRITHIKVPARRQLAGYLSKYLTKTLDLPNVRAPRYFRRVRMSRGWVDEPAWEPERRWDSWWILDASPALAAVNVRQHGLIVVHVDHDAHERSSLPGRIVQWLRSVRGYRSAGFWANAAA